MARIGTVPAQRDKTIYWQTEQNEGSEGGQAGVVGAARDKHALSFVARHAYPIGLHKARSMGRPPLRTEKWSQAARQRNIGFAVVFRLLGPGVAGQDTDPAWLGSGKRSAPWAVAAREERSILPGTSASGIL